MSDTTAELLRQIEEETAKALGRGGAEERGLGAESLALKMTPEQMNETLQILIQASFGKDVLDASLGTGDVLDTQKLKNNIAEKLSKQTICIFPPGWSYPPGISPLAEGASRLGFSREGCQEGFVCVKGNNGEGVELEKLKGPDSEGNIEVQILKNPGFPSRGAKVRGGDERAGRRSEDNTAPQYVGKLPNSEWETNGTLSTSLFDLIQSMNSKVKAENASRGEAKTNEYLEVVRIIQQNLGKSRYEQGDATVLLEFYQQNGGDIDTLKMPGDLASQKKLIETKVINLLKTLDNILVSILLDTIIGVDKGVPFGGIGEATRGQAGAPGATGPAGADAPASEDVRKSLLEGVLNSLTEGQGVQPGASEEQLKRLLLNELSSQLLDGSGLEDIKATVEQQQQQLTTIESELEDIKSTLGIGEDAGEAQGAQGDSSIRKQLMLLKQKYDEINGQIEQAQELGQAQGAQAEADRARLEGLSQQIADLQRTQTSRDEKITSLENAREELISRISALEGAAGGATTSSLEVELLRQKIEAINGRLETERSGDTGRMDDLEGRYRELNTKYQELNRLLIDGVGNLFGETRRGGGGGGVSFGASVDALRSGVENLTSLTRRVTTAEQKLDKLENYTKAEIERVFSRIQKETELTQVSVDEVKARLDALYNRLSSDIPKHMSGFVEGLNRQISDLKGQITRAQQQGPPGGVIDLSFLQPEFDKIKKEFSTQIKRENKKVYDAAKKDLEEYKKRHDAKLDEVMTRLKLLEKQKAQAQVQAQVQAPAPAGAGKGPAAPQNNSGNSTNKGIDYHLQEIVMLCFDEIGSDTVFDNLTEFSSTVHPRKSLDELKKEFDI